MGLAMWTPGPLEIVIILVIVLIIFGPKRLPDLGRSLGHGMREFKDSVTGKDKDELARSSSGTPEREPEPEPEREPATTASEQKS
jgi:sec-independent protein translocase protein TatA